MQAVGTAPILTHHSSKQEPLNFSRFGDVLNKRPGYMGMNDFTREEKMQKIFDDREHLEEEEDEDGMKDDNMMEKEKTVINNHIDNNNTNHNEEKACDLSAKVAELHATLATLKRESEQKIEKLKAENEEATKEIEKLQLQLKQQTELNTLKNNLMNNSKSDSQNLNSFFLGGGLPLPGLPPTSSETSSNLEMLLLERAKALQSNPSLNSFPGFPGQHQGFSPLRSGLFPSPLPSPMTSNLESLTSRWRSTLPANIQETDSSQEQRSLSSPGPGSPVKKEDRGAQSPERPPSSSASNSVLNGGSGSKAPSEAGTLSPRHTDSSSPMKSEESPLRDLSFQSSTGPASSLPPLAPLSPYNTSLQPLHTTPLLSTSRIPKSDPMEARLQEMLRYNMEKSAGQALDTLGDSRRVRELLSVHNIGQRLFAKYVLGLSQGTVSELLSKPKSWDKLTEKGRDSYRKMHAWCYDDNAIMLLKSLIPRKGELVRTMSSSPLVLHSPHSHPGPDKSIVDNSEASSKSGNLDLTKEQINSDSSHDAISRVYREEFALEFAKLMGGNGHGGNKPFFDPNNSPSSMMKPGFLGGHPLFQGMEGFPRPPAGDFHQALSFYHEELSRLQQSAIANVIKEQAGGATPPADRRLASATPTSDGDTSDNAGEPALDVKRERDVQMKPVPSLTPPALPLKQGPHKSPFFPGSGETPSGGPESMPGSGSPLQRMASITNSLVTTPPSVSFGCHNRAQLKTALPPITQQQFDRYSHLNTDDVVRRIKEILSQYSISQRLFGEAVLGLSQGSVSDLLARPKPWHMLTQKGREPFIRMKIFLEDETAVHRLVASQYKIAPDKLMRTGNFNNHMMGLPPNRPMTKLPENLIRPPFDNPLLPSTLRFGSDPNLSQPGSPASALLDPLAAHRKMLGIRPPAFPPTSSASPSLYEMAALTSELDTNLITSKVKEILLQHNVGQKLFGEFVLGLSQGSVSELLSKPKAWHMLSIKGREPFIRMQLWLNDPNNIEKLLNVKSDMREASKRRHGLDSSSDRSSPLDTLDEYSNPASEPGQGSLAKKPRATISDEQREALNLAFFLDPYPSNTAMEYLAQKLSLEIKNITNWFHNHRMRLKQIHGVAVENLPTADGQNFDPAKFELLLNHRKMELQGNQSLMPFLGGFNPAALGLGLAARDGADVAGLDLRFKTIDDDLEEEISDTASDRKDGDDEKNEEQKSPNPRSRRKPAAPQWVNPEWEEGSGGPQNNSNSRQEPINGVCVRNIAAFGEENIAFTEEASENIADNEAS